MLWILGTFLLEKDDRPDGKDTAAFVRWVEANDSSILAGAIIFGFGVLFFLWMLASLRARLFAAEGGVGRLATLAFASGVAVSISLMFTYLPQAHPPLAFFGVVLGLPLWTVLTSVLLYRRDARSAGEPLAPPPSAQIS